MSNPTEVKNDHIKVLACEIINTNHSFTLAETLLSKVGGWNGMDILCDAVKNGIPLTKLGFFQYPMSTGDVFDDYHSFFIEHVKKSADNAGKTELEWIEKLASNAMDAEQAHDTYKLILDVYAQLRQLDINDSYETYSSFLTLKHLIFIDAMGALVDQIIKETSNIPF